MNSTLSGILLFAHGARDPRWAAPFEAVAEHIQALEPSAPVRLAFLEFMSPDLLEAGQELADKGCQRITIAPLFLGAGGHVRKDLPLLLEQLRQRHPQVKWFLIPAIGEMSSVSDAMAHAIVHATRQSHH
ncbi:MAG: sirohydrochlorin chelatase [Burkholderiales bacterium]